MRKFTLKKGLNLPLAGAPLQEIAETKPVKRVALVGADYVGLRPLFAVQVGETVKTGQLLFTDSKNPGVRFTSPGYGTVEAIHRGERRAFQSVVIKLDENEKNSDAACETFAKYTADDLKALTREQVVENLNNSGLWTSFRTRPFGKVPALDSRPAAIFVNAMDTNPQAPDPEIVIAAARTQFATGLQVLGRLECPRLYVCHAASAVTIPGEELDIAGLEEAAFRGPHPAGLPGTHIHFLCPASSKRTVWYLNYQDVIAIGALFLTGKLDTTRVISVAGPRAKNPRLVRTRLGASVADLTQGECVKDDNRLVAGSVLNGRTATEVLGYLGRYHLQVSILEEGDKRYLLGWVMPGFTKYAFKWVNISRLIPFKKFQMTTALHGGHRAIIPIGSFEEMMPLDILPTYLLRALEIKDLEEAEALGALELEEEDLALCTFVDPGKNDFGAMLRNVLTTIEKEG